MVRMYIITEVNPDNEMEFSQSMDMLKADEEGRPRGGRVTIRPHVPNPAGYTLSLEWENKEDFECFLNSENLIFLRGTLITLCGKSHFSITPHYPEHERFKAAHFNLAHPLPEQAKHKKSAHDG